MNLIVCETVEDVAIAAADVIASVIAETPDARMIVATGNTPIASYEELARRVDRGEVDASRLRPVQLDEYLGIGEDDPRSLYGWMDRAFVTPLGVPREQVITFADLPDHTEASFAAADDALMSDGGVELTILGLGPNGHLGFNEPPSPADAPTRVIELTPESLASNAVYWAGQEVPTQAITVGMKPILASQAILLIVTGAHKADILAAALEGEVTADVPASLLQEAANVTVVADAAAAAKLHGTANQP